MKRNLMLSLLLSIRCILFIAVFVFIALLSQNSLPEISHWWSVIASLINIITIVVLLLICKNKGITYHKLICRESKGELMKGVRMILMMLVIAMAGMYIAEWLCYGKLPYFAPMMIAPIPAYLAVFNSFILPLTTTLTEDGLYLGYGVNGFHNKYTAIFIPAFIYALQHCFIPTLADTAFIAYRFLSFFPLTLWICYHYHKHRNPFYIMTGHFILNIATVLQIVITSLSPDIYFTFIS